LIAGNGIGIIRMKGKKEEKTEISRAAAGRNEANKICKHS
jgi:hypothetical protein